MHHSVKYSQFPEDQQDAEAVRDIQDYLSQDHWDKMLRYAADPYTSCKTLDMALHFTGVQGFPVFAFIRCFRPTEYQAWYDSLPDEGTP